MIILDDYQIKENTIIDIVIYPGMPIGEIVEKLTNKCNFKIIIDTEGNLYEKYNKYQCNYNNNIINLNKEYNELDNLKNDNKCNLYLKECIKKTGINYESINNEPLLENNKINDESINNKSLLDNNKIKYYNVFSLSKLLEIIRNLKRYNNFILVIDSINFITDNYSNGINEIISLLWSVIYNSNSTIITVNHYKITKIKKEYKLIPRLGVKWEFFISYQILFKNKNNELVFTVKENKEIKKLFD